MPGYWECLSVSQSTRQRSSTLVRVLLSCITCLLKALVDDGTAVVGCFMRHDSGPEGNQILPTPSARVGDYVQATGKVTPSRDGRNLSNVEIGGMTDATLSGVASHSV